MSWYSDGERFNEYEGCGYCNFKNRRSPYACGHCEWNTVDWGDDPCAECEDGECENCSYYDKKEEEE